MSEYWYVGIVFSLIGILILAFSYIKWKKLTADTYVDDKVVSVRKKYRRIGLWGLVLFAAGAGSMLESSLSFMVIVGLLFGYSRIVFEPYYKTNITDDLDELCLYLRPFSLDTQNVFKNRASYVSGVFGIPEKIEKYLCEELNAKVAQTFAIGDPNTCLPLTLSTSNIYAGDDEWKETVTKLTSKAQIIVISVGETNGSLWEISHCIKSEKLDKVIFLVDDNKYLSLLKKELGGICTIDAFNKEIDRTYAFFMDEDGMQWTYAKLKAKGDIKQLINDYIQKHPSLARALNMEKENRRVFNFSSNLGKVPAWGWQCVSLMINPIAYMLFNKWSKRWIFSYILYNVVMFLLAFIVTMMLVSAYMSDEADENLILLTSVMMMLALFLFFSIPWLILSPRISWRCRNWGSKSIFGQTNKSLALWLLACSVSCSLISWIPLFIDI